MGERRLSLDGLELAAVEHGPADAPALVALHGWLDNAASFAPLAAALGDRYRLIAIDLPGHGRSDHLPPGRLLHYHFVDYVGTVLAALDALALPRTMLLGHSLGAGVASLVAAAAPERITRLALIEGLGPLADDGTQTLARWRRAVTRMASGATRKRAFADLEAALAARVAAGGLSAELARGIVERGTRGEPGAITWSSDARLTRPSAMRMDERQVQALLAGIRCPSWLLLAQPQAPYLPSTMMHARAACIGDIRIDRLDGGHHLHMERPDEVAALLIDFLG